jgi:class 3 adenylate cyclase
MINRHYTFGGSQVKAVQVFFGSLHFTITLPTGTLCFPSDITSKMKASKVLETETVNNAQRLQSAAAPGQIVINEASYEKVKQSFSCREIGMVNMKNKSEGVMIYEVLE